MMFSIIDIVGYMLSEKQVHYKMILLPSNKVIADIEIINTVEIELCNPSGIILDMNSMNTTYINLLHDNNHNVFRSNYNKFSLKTYQASSLLNQKGKINQKRFAHLNKMVKLSILH